MAASVGGGPAGMFALLMISLTLVGILFFYGAFIAYKHAKNKTSLGLLSGISQVVGGSIMYFLTAIVVYNNHGKDTNITDAFMSLSLFFLSLGLLVTAICFIVYVKKHNKLLKVMDTVNRSAP